MLGSRSENHAAKAFMLGIYAYHVDKPRQDLLVQNRRMKACAQRMGKAAGMADGSSR